MKYQNRWLGMLAGLLLGGAAVAADTLYVQSVKTNIYASPDFSSQVIAVADQGEELRQIGRDGNWLRVVRGEQYGWVLQHTLSERKPAEKVSFFSSVFDFFKGKSSRKRPSSVVSTAGVRGLTADDKARMDQKEVAAYEAVDQMESMHIRQEEVVQFMDAR